MSKPQLLASFRYQVLMLELQAAGIEKYDAAWRDNGGYVYRDSLGRFTKQASSISATLQDEFVGPTTELFGRKIAAFDMEKSISDIAAEADAKFEELKRVADSPDRGKIVLDALISMAIPCAIAALIIVGPEVAIALATGGSLLGAVGTSLAGFAGAKITDASLQALGVENPWIRGGVNLIAAMFTGRFIADAFNFIKKGGFKALYPELAEEAAKASDFNSLINAIVKQTNRNLELKFVTDPNFFGGKKFILDGIESVKNELKPPVIPKTFTVESSLYEVGIDAKKLITHLNNVSQLERPGISLSASKQNRECVQQIAKRSEELVDLIKQKQKKASKMRLDEFKKLEGEIDWRTHLLKAELNFGGKLNEFLDKGLTSRTQPDISKAYETFLDSFKISDAKPKITFDKHFTNPSHVSENIPGTNRVGHLTKEQKIQIYKEADIVLHKIATWTKKRIHVDIIAERNRGFSQVFSDGTAAKINVGERGSATIFHEMGHILEASDPPSRSILFREARKLSDEVMDLGQIRPELKGEKAIRDKFLNPYTGKIYKNGGTEITSTGLEALANVETLKQIALGDREHLMIALSTLIS